MTSRVRVISVGNAVPRGDFDVEVHSIFPSAVNLRVTRGSLLLTLLRSGEADLPQGVRLEMPEGFSARELPVGARGSCRNGTLALENSLIIYLREGLRGRCDLASLYADMSNPAVTAAWRHAWIASRARRVQTGSVTVRSFGPAPHHQTILARQMHRAACGILKATRRNDLVGMDTLADLVGLGPGLTPAGDDFIIGYLAGLWCTIGQEPHRVRFLAATSELVLRLSTRTNDIGRTYLCCAARGQVSSRLVDLATAICSGANRAQVLRTFEAAVRVGHTSGMASVAGLLLGLTAWTRDYLVPRGSAELHAGDGGPRATSAIERTPRYARIARTSFDNVPRRADGGSKIMDGRPARCPRGRSLRVPRHRIAD